MDDARAADSIARLRTICTALPEWRDRGRPARVRRHDLVTDVVDRDEVAEFVVDAYRLVAPKSPVKLLD